MRSQLSIQDDISNLKIYQIINECFRKNYRGWMKAWYDVNNEYGAWFPTISKNGTVPNGNYGGTINYSNTLSTDGTVIIEEKYDSLPDDDPLIPINEKKRFVFGRVNGKFRFLGVFEKVQHKGKTHCEHKFERIATRVNLDDLSFIE